MTDTNQLRQWDNDHVWHPFTPMEVYRTEQNLIIEKAEGFYLIDTEGERYLDGNASMWCNVHGHRVPEIDQAIRDQLDRVAHSTLLGQANAPSIELARELARRLPGSLDKVFYSDDGATAVEVGVKLAYQYHAQKDPEKPRRDTFLCLTNAYHGDTLGSASVGGVPHFHKLFEPLLFPTIKLDPPVAFRFPEGYTADSWIQHTFQQLEQAFEQHHERLAAVVIEPLAQGAAGILTHAPGYLKRIRELATQYGVLLVADEVAVGCGRTGTFLACEQEDVVPDIVCLAKGLTGGYLPLAATVTTPQVYEAFLGPVEAMRTFFHGHTYTGNQLGCAAALATLRLMDTNNTLENVRRNAQALAERLETIKDHPHVGEIRQRGLFCGIELVADKATKERYPFLKRVGVQVCKEARTHGVNVRNLGDVVTIIPPLAMPKALVLKVADAVIESIRKVCK